MNNIDGHSPWKEFLIMNVIGGKYTYLYLCQCYLDISLRDHTIRLNNDDLHIIEMGGSHGVAIRTIWEK
jgi:hypothetical protein